MTGHIVAISAGVWCVLTVALTVALIVAGRLGLKLARRSVDRERKP